MCVVYGNQYSITIDREYYQGIVKTIQDLSSLNAKLTEENKAYETNNKNQAKELDEAFEIIGEQQKIIERYQNAEIEALEMIREKAGKVESLKDKIKALIEKYGGE